MLCSADPVGDAKNIDADGELLRLEGERREDHVTAVGATHDPDLAVGDVA